MKQYERKPGVTVVVPAYNASPYIGGCLSSILTQTFRNFEVVVVDDASSDGTPEIVSKVAECDARVILDRSNFNAGVAAARNRALSLSHRRYVAFVDGDDLWEPEKLEKQINFMKRHAAAFSYTGYRVIDPNGLEQFCSPRVPDSLTYDDLLKNTAIVCSTVMLDRDQVGDFRFPDMKTRQDYALWLSILKSGHTAYGISEVLGAYRITPNSLSRNKWKAARQNWRVYREMEKLSLLKAAWCFLNYAARGVAKHINGSR